MPLPYYLIQIELFNLTACVLDPAKLHVLCQATANDCRKPMHEQQCTREACANMQDTCRKLIHRMSVTLRRQQMQGCNGYTSVEEELTWQSCSWA